MANLGDYLGQLMAEVTLARVHADLEAVRLADYYANHPLLKTFPIPRFRLPTVTVDFPVAISGVQAARSKRGLNMTQALKVFTAALTKQMDKFEINMAVVERRRLLAALKKRFEGMKSPDIVSTSTVHVADVATNFIDETFPERVLKGTERARFVEDLRTLARVELLNLLPSPLRVKVLTNTEDLRELGPLEVLTRIQLNITEQGLEWKGDESKTGNGKKLLPE
jgi:hypothetical protein